MKNILLIFNIVFLIHTGAFSKVKNNGTPFIKNYTRNNYNAGTQNWGMIQSQDDIMYYANNEGVLEFDGNAWRIIPMPNNSVVRSLAIDSLSIIYVGAYNEFGVLKTDEKGKLVYHSLTNLLQESDRDFEEVWQIFPYKNGMIFHTFQKTFYYKENKISVIEAKNELHLGFIANNKFLVRDQNVGLCELNGRSFVLVKNGEFFKDIEIVKILPFSEGKVLIATALNGLYLFDGEKVVVWSPDLSQLFKQHQLFTAEKIGENKFVFGTVRNGVYLIDANGELVQNINTKNGLQNNTVLSLFFDNSENLWVGLDNGIDYLEISSPLSNIPKERDLGTGYASIHHDGYLYLGTNTGLYTRKYNFENGTQSLEDEFELVKNTSGQVWSLQVVAGELICGHNKGTFRVDKKKGELISNIEGGWKYLYQKEHPNKMIGGTYTGLVLFEKSDSNKWKFVKRIEGFEESSREMVWNDDNSIWMCHGYKGVYRLYLNDDFSKCLNYYFYGEKDGFESNLNINVHKLKGEHVFSSNNGFYKYIPESNRFEKHISLNNIFGSEYPVNKLFEEENGNVWFFQNENVGLLKLQLDNSYEKVSKQFASLEGSFVGAFENIHIVDRENVLFGTEGGFVHYDPTIVKRYDQSFKALIRQVEITSPKDSVIYHGTYANSKEIQFNQDGDNQVNLPFRYNGIQFHYSAPQYSEANLMRYQYQLVGFDENLSEWNHTLQKEYTNLHEGDYVFRVIAKNQFGVNSVTDEFHFTILPPWYRSIVAFIIYTIVGLFCVYGIVFIVKRRVRRLQNVLKKKQEEELRIKEQKYREEALVAEKEIVQLRNDKLRSEVDFKNKELASSTMNIIHKNEVLSYSVGELKKALRKIKDPTALVQVRQLMKTIDSEFNSEQDWEQFEVHFDQVHEDFLKRIRLKHPQLTPKDLRICAYLRMNLSTKEIAPLMNISVRGVEISRYRLRKKFDLTRDENLIDFILSV